MKRNIEEEIRQAERTSTVAQDKEVIIDKDFKVVIWWAEEDNRVVDLYAYGKNIFCHHDNAKEILDKIKFIKKQMKKKIPIEEIIKRWED